MCFAKDKAVRQNVRAVEEVYENLLFVGTVDFSEDKQASPLPKPDGRTSQLPTVHTVLTDNWTILPITLDTGTKANLINVKNFGELSQRPGMTNKMVAVKAYNGQTIKTKSTCHLTEKRNTRKLENVAICNCAGGA